MGVEERCFCHEYFTTKFLRYTTSFFLSQQDSSCLVCLSKSHVPIFFPIHRQQGIHDVNTHLPLIWKSFLNRPNIQDKYVPWHPTYKIVQYFQTMLSLHLRAIPLLQTQFSDPFCEKCTQFSLH